jgi:hypothetical protein
MPDEGRVKNIRDLLGEFIGERLVDVTQHDDHDARDEASPRSEVFLHFGNGQTLHFWINEVEGFEILGLEA